MNLLLISCFLDSRFKNSIPAKSIDKMLKYLDEVLEYPIIFKEFNRS